MTPATAVDEILTMFKTAWDTTGHQFHIETKRKPRDTDNESWCEVYIRHAHRGQDTLGGVGNRIFTSTGVVIMPVFSPVEKGLSESLTLAKLLVDAYEGKESPSGVRFKNARMMEKGRESQFFENHVLVDFSYDETK